MRIYTGNLQPRKQRHQEKNKLDIGQTVVVKDRAVLAVEAIEGTDAALRRAGELAPGGVAVKVAKPRQDPRFDMPAIGLQTLEVLAEARTQAERLWKLL